LKDPDVIRFLEQKAVCLKMDAEKETNLASLHRIEAYPTMLLLKPDGNEMDRLVGFREPKAFIEDFTAALQGKNSVVRAKEKRDAAADDDPMARMQYGQALAQGHHDADALKEYLWCFDEGAAKPGFTGVRVSFLLNAILELGRSYPPARQALETRRDAAEAKLKGGSSDFQLTMDVINLNRTLAQPERNLAVFDALPPGSQARKTAATLILEQLVEAKRYTNVVDSVDPDADFGRAVEMFKTQERYMAAHPNREALMPMLRKHTVAEGAMLFEALAGAGEPEKAKALAGQILQFDASAETRQRLNDAAERAGSKGLLDGIKPAN